jgi:alpha-tubulin suppressor-like RCC1 family protein
VSILAKVFGRPGTQPAKEAHVARYLDLRSIIVLGAVAVLSGACTDPANIAEESSGTGGYAPTTASASASSASGAGGGSLCGNGAVDPGEECDQGPANGQGACSATCRNRQVLQLSASRVASVGSTCALLSGGAVKCWGYNGAGQLGLGDATPRGDEAGQMGSDLPAVDLGGGQKAIAVSVGISHACALLSGGALKCWGSNAAGELGLGDTVNRGDQLDEMGDALPAVDLGAGRTAVAVSLGWEHTCAVLDDGAIKCWGSGAHGALGLGDSDNRGDQPGEMGDALPPVDLGAGKRAVAVSTSNQHTCALLEGGTVKCWGQNEFGELGLGDTEDRGDQPGEMGDALPAVDLGAGRTAHAVSAGITETTCAVLDGGSVKCWGHNAIGSLGLSDGEDRGDQPGEMGDALPAVDLGAGRIATAVSTGDSGVCALLGDGHIKCWGWNTLGQLGLGDKDSRGILPGQMGDALPTVDLGTGRTATDAAYTCGLLDDGSVKCWGFNLVGQLGLGDHASRGDNPDEMGDHLPAVKLFSSTW